MKRIRHWIGVAGLALAELLCARPALAQEAECPPPGQSAAKAAPDGRDRGLLWRLERGGRVSYLYGTLHVGRPAWSALGPKLREALAASDVLAVELDVSSTDLMQAFVRALPVLPEFSAALAERMAAAAKRECGDPPALAAMPPLLRAVMLAMLPALREGFDPQLGSERLLLKAAREASRAVVSLEDAEMQAQVLAPERPGDLETSVAAMVEQMERGRSRALLLRLIGAWERGDAAELADYTRWCECVDNERDRAWFERINDRRNPALASRIDALHSAGQRVFAAIGALHMSGPDALPRLLAARGFVVQPVALQ